MNEQQHIEFSEGIRKEFALFGKGRSTMAEHILNVFEEGELESSLTCRKFRQVCQEHINPRVTFAKVTHQQ